MPAILILSHFQDGSLLVTLVPSNLPMTTVVGLYSLRQGNLGACYATYRCEINFNKFGQFDILARM